jgi:hypothetical protein
MAGQEFAVLIGIHACVSWCNIINSSLMWLPTAHARRSLIALMLLCASPAAAQDPAKPQVGEAQKRAAAKSFAEGKAAFLAGDYLHAGRAFEEAYALAPHEDASWNAASAWHRGGELVRAANLYVRYLGEAPPGAADRNTATRALHDLSQRLGRLEIHAAGFDEVRLDAEPIAAETRYVTPGTHKLTGRRGERDVEQVVSIDAGAMASVTLEMPFEPPPSPIAPTVARRHDPTPVVAPARSGISPVVAWVGAGLTVATLGVATWSSFDTLAARSDYDRAPDADKLDDGRSKMVRTNVLWGVGAGLAAATVFTAVVLVDWKRGQHAQQLAVSADHIVFRGRF